MHKYSGDYRPKVFSPDFNFDFGDWFELDAATMFDTVLLALMHVAIALVDFFSELLAGKRFVGKCRQNAPCPDLIVPFLMERRGLSSKSLVSIAVGGN